MWQRDREKEKKGRVIQDEGRMGIDKLGQRMCKSRGINSFKDM